MIATAAVLGAAAAAVAGTAVASSGGTAQAAAPIVLGNVGSYSSPFGAPGGVKQGLTTWMKWVNDHGGINGHKVVIKFKDDAGDPTKALTAVKSLIDDDKVIAIIDPVSFATSWQSYATSKGVPTITSSGGLYGSGLAFSAGTTQNEFSISFPKAAKLGKVKSYALLYCAELAVCKQAGIAQGKQARALGLKYTEAAVSGSAPDYTAVCLSLKNAGVDGVMLGVVTNTSVRIAESCVRQGYHPQWVTSGAALSKAVEQSPAMDNVVAVLNSFPWFASDNPAMREFQTALKKYYPKITSDAVNYDAGLSSAWTAGKAFEKAAASLGDTPTSADLVKGLLTIKNDTLQGLAPALTFHVASPPANWANYQQPASPCFFLIQLKNGKWTKPYGRATYSAC